VSDRAGTGTMTGAAVRTSGDFFFTAIFTGRILPQVLASRKASASAAQTLAFVAGFACPLS